MDESTLKVLVVDDTVTYRQILSDVVGRIPGLALAATAPSGEVALKKIAQNEVDVVLLDVFMPDMDGVQTLERIRKEFPDVFTIMISGATTRHADITIKALNLGAIDFVPKPTVEGYEQGVAELVEALKPIMRVIKVKRLARKAKRTPTAAPVARPRTEETAAPAPVSAGHFAPVPKQFRLVLIGVSTGGPNALHDVLCGVPRDFPLPILIVQHMPPLFTDSLAKSLAKDSGLDVREAKENDSVKPGSVLVAPGGRHMTIRTDPAAPSELRIGLNDMPPVNSCRPSVDVLFRSAAALGGGSLAIVLTGMGEDGAAGVGALKRKGCYCIAQNEETCVVYGMPRSVIEKGLSDEVLALDRIAARVSELGKAPVSAVR